MLTDFNDLHLSKGLSAVADLISTALAGASPHPIKAQADQNQGAISQEEMADIIPFEPEFTLEKCLQRFALTECGSKVWDSHKKQLLRKSGFRDRVGRAISAEWFDSPKKRAIDDDAVKLLTNERNTEQARSMIDRYVFITMGKEAWDLQKRMRVPRDPLREQYPLEYDIWLRSPARRQVDPDQIVFDPSQKSPPDCINTFSGLPLTVMDLPIYKLKEICAPILELLFWLCERDASIAIWVMRWIAIPLQKQGAKMASALLFHGDVQGAGKSLFFYDVMSRLYGQYSVVLGQHQLESQYNDWQNGKLYAVFEEIFGGSGRYQNMGKVKHLITGKTIRIEKKFLSGWEESNHVNVVFLSNENQPLAIEKNDRRHLVCWPEQQLSQPIIDAVVAALDDPDQTVLRAWYSYLLQLDLCGQDEHTQPPMTESKQRIIDYGLPSHESFYRDWKSGLLKEPYISCTTNQLYTAYCRWCRSRNEKEWTMTKFVPLIVKIDREAKISKDLRKYRLDGVKHQHMCFMINEPIDHGGHATAQDWLSEQIQLFNDATSVPSVLER